VVGTPARCKITHPPKEKEKEMQDVTTSLSFLGCFLVHKGILALVMFLGNLACHG
jgi:hypothetical protein